MPQNYIARAVDLTSLADSIRENCYTSGPLVWPSGFINAIKYNEDRYIETGIAFDSTYTNNEITSIPNGTFALKKNLKEVSFPECITIGMYAFAMSPSLISASFPKCTTICYGVFLNCHSISNIYLPKVTSIDSYAFCSTLSLSFLNLPECTFIERNAFASAGLISISIPKCEILNSCAFMSCMNLLSISLPSCISIYSGAFGNCYSLNTVYAPVCQNLSDQCFMGCFNLISLYMLSNSVATLEGTSAFYSSPIGGYSTSAGRFGSVYVPASLLTAYQTATNWASISARIVAFSE